jgi:general secretion pathway protein H
MQNSGRTFIINSGFLTVDSRKAGFTLLEVLIVIVLAAFIAGLSAVFLSNMLPSARLAATARDISATVRYARALAQINGETQTVTIDLDSRNYGLEGRGTKTIPAEVNVKVTDPFSGDVTQGQYTITAYTSGAMNGCTVVLWNRKKTLSIQTDPVVGVVVIK